MCKAWDLSAFTGRALLVELFTLNLDPPLPLLESCLGSAPGEPVLQNPTGPSEAGSGKEWAGRTYPVLFLEPQLCLVSHCLPHKSFLLLENSYISLFKFRKLGTVALWLLQ